MSTVRVVPAAELPTVLTGARSPLWWGIVLLVVIETTVFATLISSYFYLQLKVPQWPPAGIPTPDLTLPIINTIVLFTSSVAVLWGSRGIRNGDQRRLKIGVGAGFLLEVVFFVIKIILSRGIPYGMTDHVYGSIFWMINRLHTFHVFVAILMAGAAGVLAWRGYYTAERRVGIEAINIYWQFVALIWIPVFVVLFLVPRWV